MNFCQQWELAESLAIADFQEDYWLRSRGHTYIVMPRSNHDMLGMKVGRFEQIRELETVPECR